jgi:type III pantothenate kinase
MLLAVDIGNTNLTCGIFADNKLKRQFDLPSKTYKIGQLTKRLGGYPKLSACVICSVVPKLAGIIQRELKPLVSESTYILGKDLAVPIKNRYRFPKQVGPDRLVNAYAAAALYGSPLVVIDSGTAITFDAISREGAYLGGLIFPGIRICLETLNEKTALLPLVKLQEPAALIGRDTQNSILSGVVLGIAALTKELSARIKQSLGKDTGIIGTGGNIALIKKYSGIKITINQNLTLLGIKLIYDKMRAGRRLKQ